MQCLIPFITLLGVLLSSSLISQDTTSVRGLEVSLNASKFVRQYLSFSEPDFFTEDPYLLSLHIPVGQSNSYLRTGLGFDIVESTDENEDSGGNVSKRENTAIQVDFRFGIETRKEIHKRFKIHYGLDALFSYDNVKAVSEVNGEFVSELKSYATGFGPVVGVSFYINENISIWTEATMYLIYSNQTQESSFGQSQFNDSQKRNQLRASVSEPLSVHFRMML